MFLTYYQLKINDEFYHGKGWFKKKKKLMEFSIKGPDPPTHPP